MSPRKRKPLLHGFCSVCVTRIKARQRREGCSTLAVLGAYIRNGGLCTSRWLHRTCLFYFKEHWTQTRPSVWRCKP